jgi:hypothetical protein
MPDHIDGVMRALSQKQPEWKEDLFFAVKVVQEKLSKYIAAVNPTMGMVCISANLLDPFRKLRSFRNWDKGMGIIPKEKTSYTTQFKEACLK